MTSVSRPLIGLLVATVAFFAVWTLALKHSSSGSGGGAANTTVYKSAIDKAHQAVASSDAASVAHGGTVATTPQASATGATPTASTAAPTASTATPAPLKTTAHSTGKAAAAATASHTLHSAVQRANVVQRAMRANKVVAVLFFNWKAADDRAIKKELAAVPTHNGHVVKLAVPLSELTHYPVITTQVPITGSPTLVLIDRAQHASTIVGFSDRFEITQRVDQALAVL